MNTNNSTIWTRDFILLCLATLLMATAFYFLIPTLPVFITEIIKAEKGVTGAILAAFTVSALIVRPFVGYALDRWGRKVIYLISFFLMMLLFNGYVFASTIFLMVLCLHVYYRKFCVPFRIFSSFIYKISPLPAS